MRATASARKRKAPVIIWRKRTAASRLAPTTRPLEAVITCLDSARTTGVATYVCGRLHSWCEVQAREPSKRLDVLRDHITTAYMRGLQHALVLEVPWGGQLNAALSLSATAALWRDSWTQLGYPKHLIVERTSNDWRRALFGKRTLEREQARVFEMHRAMAVVMHDVPANQHVVGVGPDAAAAICIGQVMIRSAEIRTAIGCDLVESSRR